MVSRFTEVDKYTGYIVRRDSNQVVGIWIWHLGNLSLSTDDVILKDTLSHGLSDLESQINAGKVIIRGTDVNIATMTPVEVSNVLYPDYVLIRAEQVENSKTIQLPPNYGSYTRRVVKVLRGYVLEAMGKHKFNSVGVWYDSPFGIAVNSPESSLMRTIRALQVKGIKRAELQEDGSVKLTTVPYEDASYWELTLSLPEKYSLVPATALEVKVQ